MGKTGRQCSMRLCRPADQYFMSYYRGHLASLLYATFAASARTISPKTRLQTLVINRKRYCIWNTKSITHNFSSQGIGSITQRSRIKTAGTAPVKWC